MDSLKKKIKDYTEKEMNFEFILKTKSSYIFIENILYLLNKSVKRIICKVTRQYIHK